MSILSNLKDFDLKDLAREIVQDTANDVKNEVDAAKILKLLKEGNSPKEIASQLSQDLNLVETLKDEAIKNIKQQVGLEKVDRDSIQWDEDDEDEDEE